MRTQPWVDQTPSPELRTQNKWSAAGSSPPWPPAERHSPHQADKSGLCLVWVRPPGAAPGRGKRGDGVAAVTLETPGLNPLSHDVSQPNGPAAPSRVQGHVGAITE